MHKLESRVKFLLSLEIPEFEPSTLEHVEKSDPGTLWDSVYDNEGRFVKKKGWVSIG